MTIQCDYYIDKLLFYLTCVQINTCVQMNKHPILIPSKMIQFLKGCRFLLNGNNLMALLRGKHHKNFKKCISNSVVF